MVEKASTIPFEAEQMNMPWPRWQNLTAMAFALATFAGPGQALAQGALVPPAQIPGQPPSLISPPPGCPFHPRCFLSNGRERCREEEPPLRPLGPDGHVSACHFAEELEGQQSKQVETPVEAGV